MVYSPGLMCLSTEVSSLHELVDKLPAKAGGATMNHSPTARLGPFVRLGSEGHKNKTQKTKMKGKETKKAEVRPDASGLEPFDVISGTNVPEHFGGGWGLDLARVGVLQGTRVFLHRNKMKRTKTNNNRKPDAVKTGDSAGGRAGTGRFPWSGGIRGGTRVDSRLGETGKRQLEKE